METVRHTTCIKVSCRQVSIQDHLDSPPLALDAALAAFAMCTLLAWLIRHADRLQGSLQAVFPQHYECVSENGAFSRVASHFPMEEAM